MLPTERAQKIAKLRARANDFRGNEHERKLAQEQWERWCAAEGEGGGGPAAKPPEFNRVERGVIRAGAALLVGASLLADWLNVRRRRQRRKAQSQPASPPAPRATG